MRIYRRARSKRRIASHQQSHSTDKCRHTRTQKHIQTCNHTWHQHIFQAQKRSHKLSNYLGNCWPADTSTGATARRRQRRRRRMCTHTRPGSARHALCMDRCGNAGIYLVMQILVRQTTHAFTSGKSIRTAGLHSRKAGAVMYVYMLPMFVCLGCPSVSAVSAVSSWEHTSPHPKACAQFRNAHIISTRRMMVLTFNVYFQIYQQQQQSPGQQIPKAADNPTRARERWRRVRSIDLCVFSCACEWVIYCVARLPSE